MKENKNTSVLLRLLPYFLTEKKRFLFSIFTVFVVTGAGLIRPYILRYIIDSVSETKNVADIYYASGAFLLSLVIAGFVSYLQTITLAKMGISIINRLKKRVFSHILKQGMSFFDKNQPGQLMSRTESDIEALKVIFTNSAVVILSSVLILIGIVGIIIREQPKLGIIISFICPFLFFIFYFYMRYIRVLWTNVRKKNSEISGYITEYVQAVPVLQLFMKKDQAIKGLEKLSNDKYKLQKKVFFVDQMIFWSFFNFLSETASVMLILFYGVTEIFKGNMTIGTLIMFADLLKQFFWPLRNLMMVVNQVNSSLAAGNRVFNILDTDSDVVDDHTSDEKVTLDKNLIFDNITFKYVNEDVLKNININIKKGEHVAIVGPSGSGKTTLINILLRFYKLESGQVLVDGKNIEEYSINNWRENIGLVLQDVNLFPGTIMENLKAFNTDISDEMVIDAAKKLNAHDTIMKKPDAYDTYLAEDGKNLSMGERQLLSFTRALVKNPDILILDEATSSVDVITESMIQNALLKLMEGRTAIVIAHRLSTIKHADRIFVFDEGKVVEEGNHQTLIEKKGMYFKLHNIQKIKEVSA